jgi:hypothetical protein
MLVLWNNGDKIILKFCTWFKTIIFIDNYQSQFTVIVIKTICSTNFKLLRQIEVNLTNNCAFFKVCSFCQGQQLWLLAPSVKKPIYDTYVSENKKQTFTILQFQVNTLCLQLWFNSSIPDDELEKNTHILYVQLHVPFHFYGNFCLISNTINTFVGLGLCFAFLNFSK